MAEKLTKANIIDDLHKRFDESIPKKSISAIYDEIGEQILEAAKAGNKYPMGRLGHFETTDVAARKARNPRTGETIEVPASKRVKFKPSAFLKREVNQ